MKISATVASSAATHEVTVRTGTISQSLAVPAKVTGRGSSINGGEFLMLALATCYCNDLYREAERLRIPIEGAQVEATAEFPGTGWQPQTFATVPSSSLRPMPRQLASCCAKPMLWPKYTIPFVPASPSSCFLSEGNHGTDQRSAV